MSSHSGEHLPLSKAAEFLLEECRMVLPGIQALLGFQLIVIFNAGFDQKIGIAGQRLHLVAIGLISLAVILIMAPAAYHRQTTLHEVSASFVRIASRLLLFSMLPLALGICLDFGLIANVLLQNRAGTVLAGILFVLFVLFWFVLPRSRKLRSLLDGA